MSSPAEQTGPARQGADGCGRALRRQDWHPNDEQPRRERVVPLADGVTEAALLARAAAASSADGQDPVDAAIRAAAVERGEPPLSVIRFTPSIHARDIWTPMVSNYLQQLGNVEAQPS